MAEPDTDRDWRALAFRPPAFRPDDLRLAGDLCSDPVTKAIRHDLLSFGSPVWCDGLRELPALVRAWWPLDALTVAIRQDALRFVEMLHWSEGRSAMERVLLKHCSRLFRAEPSVAWATFTEPQLTKGFAHFLNAPESGTRIRRVRALLKGLGAAKLGNDMSSDVKVTAEAPTAGNKRIDLLIEWTGSTNERYAVAIEAKLGHVVTSGQLPAYRVHLRNVAKERRLLAVVSPHLSDHTAGALRRNREWRWAAWRNLLLAHERALPADSDDEAYLRFRRTLWDQTG